MTTTRITQPASEPITLAEAKAHLRLTHDDEDLLVSAMSSSARAACEDRLQRTLITSSWKLTLPAFRPVIYLPMGDVQSVTAVTYKDQAGTTQILSQSAYQLGRLNGQPLLMPAPGQSWPATLTGVIEAVDIEYLAGYGDTADKVPSPIKAWILLALGDLFENRQATNIGSSVNRLSFADGLLDTYRNILL
ncbi:phage head-tail connector protein [Malikia sp.]|uniref:head-tail connector protein n=1 Tax=Malikia sp. TaxID=2070706 RepID=UPI0026227D77|nr:phage head-tail connector protein [Malikia sp.]MDD2728318.1 phage head-tail connector protein [Malikia sp.]